jgi:hypothetical protein
MVRPRVARGIRRSGVSGLASMYPVSDWSSLCSGPLWISARMRSHYRTGLNGPFGSPVFACAGKTDPPSLLILSQTSAGKGFGVITSSLVLSMPLAIRRAQAGCDYRWESIGYEIMIAHHTLPLGVVVTVSIVLRPQEQNDTRGGSSRRNR